MSKFNHYEPISAGLDLLACRSTLQDFKGKDSLGWTPVRPLAHGTDTG